MQLTIHLNAFYNSLQLTSLAFSRADLSVGEVKLPDTNGATARNKGHESKILAHSKQFHESFVYTKTRSLPLHIV